MTGETKDGFGWEYYVGRYDGLGRRRRRWVRSLRRVAGVSGRRSGLAGEDRIGERRNATDTTSVSSIEEKKMSPTLLRAIIDQYNFKGFGWSLYKSLIWKKSFGASLRIPLSTNFAFFDRYAAIPFLSSSTYFGYPWVIATFLNASVPLEAIEWVIGGILWKIKWGIAVASALLRCAIEALVWFVMTPWRTVLALRQIMSIVARRYLSKSGMAQSLMESIDAEAKNDDDDNNDDESRKPLKNETKDDNIDGLIELSTASTNNSGNGDISPVTTTAIVGSTRGGAFNTATTSPSKRFRTMLGHQVPTFHRTTNIEYSTIVSQRFGVCISWRMSKERGYEYRWNFFCSFLPTQECWEHLDKVARKELNKFQRFASKSGKAWDIHDGFSSQSSAIQSFLYDHSATLGLSSGFPLPSDPFFSFNLLLNLSGFYYGWLLRYIASMLCLHRDRPKADGAEIASGATIEKETENSPLVGGTSAVNVERRSEEKEALDDGSSGEDEE
ncbi:hypothetical protein HJC23_001824 [Cyclotella cryptica]|uniref:Peroxin/Ferlin domain-containing protein n=1 Tax=Cyclotella cryptica TaxID=29204 RepID=A0ABD3PI70_9STRA